MRKSEEMFWLGLSFSLVGEAAKMRAGEIVSGKLELDGSENRRVGNYEGYRRLSKLMEKMSKGVTRRESDLARLSISKEDEH